MNLVGLSKPVSFGSTSTIVRIVASGTSHGSVAGDLERTTRARRGLLENQDDLLAFQALLLVSGVFCAFQVAGKIKQILEFPLGEILHGQQRAVAEIEAHCRPLIRLGGLGSTLHWLPARACESRSRKVSIKLDNAGVPISAYS
jgi:hypothetical protein